MRSEEVLANAAAPPARRASPAAASAAPRPADVNCTPAHARQLGALLQGKDMLVNLIPWNPILSPSIRCAGVRAVRERRPGVGRHTVPRSAPFQPPPRVPPWLCSFAAPAEGATAEFHRILRWEYGVNCTVRAEKGQDISGACGQLVLEHGGRAAGGGGGGCSSSKLADVEDLLPLPLPLAGPPPRAPKPVAAR